MDFVRLNDQGIPKFAPIRHYVNSLAYRYKNYFYEYPKTEKIHGNHISLLLTVFDLRKNKMYLPFLRSFFYVLLVQLLCLYGRIGISFCH